jgi:hypothetical protein
MDCSWPAPSPLTGADGDAFTNDSILRRLPIILRETAAAAAARLPALVSAELEALARALEADDPRVVQQAAGILSRGAGGEGAQLPSEGSATSPSADFDSNSDPDAAWREGGGWWEARGGDAATAAAAISAGARPSTVPWFWLENAVY